MPTKRERKYLVNHGDLTNSDSDSSAFKRQHTSKSRSSAAVDTSAISGTTTLQNSHVPSEVHHIPISEPQLFVDPVADATSSTPPPLLGSKKPLALEHKPQGSLYFHLRDQEKGTVGQSEQKEKQLEQDKKQLQQEKQQLQQEKQQLQQEKQQLQQEKQQLRSDLKQVTDKEERAFLIRSIGKVEDQITEITKQYGSIQEKILQLIVSPEQKAQNLDSQSQWLQNVGLDELPAWSKNKEGVWDKLEWNKDTGATEYINEMLAGKFEIAQPRDGEPETFVRKLTLKGTLYGREKDQSLYLPIHIYGVFHQAVRVLENDSSSGVVIVGPPGIGKSFGLRWALLILARKRRTVVLEDGKERTGYLFVPSTSGKYAAYSLRKFESSKCEVLKHDENFYLFDPSKPGYPPISRTLAKTIMAASPDPAHYQELVLKHYGEKLVIEPYETIELIAMYRLGLGKGLIQANGADKGENKVEDVIKMRANRVGGLTRYVLCKEAVYLDRFQQVQYRVKSIAENRIDFDGTLSVEQSMNSSDPPSTLMYTRRKNTPMIVDKEPQLEKDDHYRDSSNVWLHSVGILDQLWTLSFKRVLSRVQRANRMASTVAAFEFEDLVVMMFTRPKSTHDKAPIVFLRECDGNGNKWPQRNLAIPEGLHRLSAEECGWKGALLKLMGMSNFVKCKLNTGWRTVVSHAFEKKIGVLLANTKNNPVWDMALASNVLVNCTVSLAHTLPAGHLIQIFKALDEAAKGECVILYFLWIVPDVHRKPIIANLKWADSYLPNSRRLWQKTFEKRLRQITLVLLPGTE